MESSEYKFNFTVAENRIRKRWLLLSTLLPAIVLGIVTIMGLLKVIFEPDLSTIFAFVLLVFFSSIGFYLNYHCAYKKQGTILLLLTMIGLSCNIIFTFFDPKKIVLLKMSIPTASLVIAALIYQITLLYYTYQLRQINKKMRVRVDDTNHSISP